MTVPSDPDIQAALADLRVRLPGAGVQKLVQALKSAHPDWAPAVDSKRVRALRDNAPPPPPMLEPSSKLEGPRVLTALEDIIKRLCAGGDLKASRRAAQIDMVLKATNESTSTAFPPPHAFTAHNFQHLVNVYPLRSCKLAATLVLIFCAPDDARPKVLKWLSRSLGGLPTMVEVGKTPSADVGAMYMRARARVEKAGETTAVAVNLVDVEMLKMGTDKYESFSHAFVLVVAPEGVRVFQAWGEHGYSLGENVEDKGKGKLRTLDEGMAYVRDFERLCAMKGAWSREINRLYAQLFNVDVLAITQRGTRPIVPKFRAWVRVLEIADVRWANVERWREVFDAIDGQFEL